jgi:transcriptional regulator with XRE-family HTH domain
MENKLVEWVNQEYFRLGWSIRGISRKCDFSASHISNVLSGKKRVTFDFCEQMAKAFDKSVWEFAIMADVLPDYDQETRDIKLVIGLFLSIPKEQRGGAISYLKFIKDNS